MADLNDLAKRLNKYADKLEAAPSKVAAEVSLVLIKELVERTPVDTSKAISNWILSIGEPVLIEQDAFFPGIRGSTYTASSNEVVAFARTQVSKKRPGQSVFVSNAADYIAYLENGSSSQAPTGFTKQSVSIARNQIKATFKRIMKDGR